MKPFLCLLLLAALGGCAIVDATVGTVGSVVETGVDVTGSVVSGTVDAATSPMRDD